MIRAVLIATILALSVCAELKMVVEWSRHGARSPNHKLPSFLSISDYDFGEGGVLTEVGKEMHRDLGKKVRAKYIEELGLLNNTYNPEEFDVISSGSNRVYESAVAQLETVYPGADIPVKQSHEIDDVVRSLEHCKLSPVLMAGYLLTGQWTAWNKRYEEPLLKEIHDKWGIWGFMDNNAVALAMLDEYRCLKAEGAPLIVPDLSEKAQKQADSLISDGFFDLQFWWDGIARITSTP